VPPTDVPPPPLPPPPSPPPPSPPAAPRRQVCRSPRRGVLAGLAIGLASAGAGIVVGALTLPTTDELQRASVEELGLDPDVVDHPLVSPILDEVSARVQGRVVEEARGSVVWAVATAAAVSATGVALVAGRRTRPSTGDD